tara:strand:+ start:473 stop:577 length:105 start_codon:yes stop_codon:yes gene_type:complete
MDMTWMFIVALEKLGLASKLQYPSEKRMAALAWD